MLLLVINYQNALQRKGFSLDLIQRCLPVAEI